MKEVCSSDYQIDTIVPFVQSNLNIEATYLWIWHADKIPPHIGISTSNSYFSLKSSGKDLQLPISSVIELIERKEIKTLAVELRSSIDKQDLITCFSHYQKATFKEVTCLDPIKEALGLHYPSKLDFLLHELASKNEIVQYIGFNLDQSFKGIPYYTVADIHARLEQLSVGS